MKIKKVDDKPMVIHTKEKTKIHAHEPKGARIKGSNIYTVERGPKVHDTKADANDKQVKNVFLLYQLYLFSQFVRQINMYCIHLL